MLYCDITRPHLWPTPTLLEARFECQDRLRFPRTGPAAREECLELLFAIERELDTRNVSQKARTSR